MAIGSVSVGVILQKKMLNPFTAMGIGATCIFIGLLATFPPQSLPALYKLSPIMAFPGVFIAGVGDPIMTIATLRALYDIQVYVFSSLNIFKLSPPSKFLGSVPPDL